MPTAPQGWQKHHVRIAPHKPDRGLQDWKPMEDQEGKCGGVFEVSIE